MSLYLDNAATSFPKPPAVARAMRDYLARHASNPGRGAYTMARENAARLDRARREVGRLWGVEDPSRVILGLNATDTLNLAIRGTVRRGDRVVTTGLEHNAVTRPLHALARERRLEVRALRHLADFRVDPRGLQRAIPRGTRLVIVNHASNVLGVVQDLGPIAARCRAAGALLLVDASQSAGLVPFAMDDLGADLVAFSGHKGLYGPTGTGVLLVRRGIDLAPVRQGGTGGLRSEESEQPRDLPGGYEAGTINAVGLAGLVAGVRFVRRRGIAALRAQGRDLALATIRGLRRLGRKVRVLHPSPSIGIVSLTARDLGPQEVAAALDASFDIAVGAGLSCAPAAHRLAGTFPAGAVRVSFGAFHTAEDVAVFLDAMRHILREPAKAVARPRSAARTRSGTRKR